MTYGFVMCTAVQCTLSFCNVITTLSQKITEMMKGVFIIVISILIHGLSMFLEIALVEFEE